MISRNLHKLLCAATITGLLGIAANTTAAPIAVAPDNVPSYWVLSAAPTELWVPNHGHNLDAPGCASASYTIGSDGVPRNITLEKVVPNSDLGQTVVQAVEHFRYRPAAENRAQRPIRTYYTAQFNMRDFTDEKKAALTAKCDLPGY